jgi:hypothetical protein
LLDVFVEVVVKLFEQRLEDQKHKDDIGEREKADVEACEEGGGEGRGEACRVERVRERIRKRREKEAAWEKHVLRAATVRDGRGNSDDAPARQVAEE